MKVVRFKNIRYALEALLLGLAFVVFRLMPLDAASAVGGFLGRLIGVRLAASRKADRNLQRAMPELSAGQRGDIIRGMWDNLGRVVAEYPHLKTIAAKRLHVVGEAHLDDALALREAEGDGRGVVLFSAHMANWEMAPMYLGTVKKADAHLMYRAPNNPWVDRMILFLRSAGGRVVAWSKSRAGGQGAMKAVRSGGALAILVDQKYNQGINVPFFGLGAMVNPFFVKIARKFDAPLVPVTMRRLKGAYFEMVIHPPLQVQDRSDEEVIEGAHAILEAGIRACPEQWLWLHRRFKKKRKG